MYEALQQEHIKILGEREVEKQNIQRSKIMQEKALRDKQLQEEKNRKKRETRENFAQEVDLVRRLQAEMD